MPEGDTVRRTAAGLQRALAGRVLTVCELRWGELGSIDLTGRQVISSHAYGKHLLLRLAAGSHPSGRIPTITDRPVTLHSHLRMDGAWLIRATGSAFPAAAQHLRAVLATEEWTAFGVLLGMLDVVPTDDEHTLIGHLGPDLMADDWDDDARDRAMTGLSADPRRWVGQALLDQRAVAGIGTFYMAETLFLHGVSPWTPVGEVDLAMVLATARRLLLRGVLHAIPSTTGSTRRRQNSYVHGRSGLPCRRCGDLVRVAQVQATPHQRPAFYCATCQPGPTPTDSGRQAQPLGSVPHRFGSRRNLGLGPPGRPRIG